MRTRDDRDQARGARLPVCDVDAAGESDPTRRFVPVEEFARMLSIGERSAWRLIASRHPAIEVVRLGRQTVRVRLRERSADGTRWQ
jgi:hypothetical protein